jgi:dolichol-phosphate mannosyltransferase
LLAPVILLFMLKDGQSRQWWRRREPYVAALLALAIFSPVILWNAQHDWASFAFQTSRRLAEAPRFALHKLFASALVLITPTGVLAVALFFVGAPGAAAALAGATGADAARRRLFTSAAILVPLAVFAIFSLRHEVKLDWTGAPWTAALPVMASGMVAAGTGANGLRSWVRSAWPPTLVVTLLICAAGLHYLTLGLPGLGYGKHTELIPVGWRELSLRISDVEARVRAETGSEPLLVGMDRYAIASELKFYADPAQETSSAHLFGGMGLMYERWTPPEQQEGRTLLLVAWNAGDLTGSAVESHAERWGPVEEDVVSRGGRVIRHYYHRVAYNYRRIPRS